jgi:Tol biopolymer transport system component
VRALNSTESHLIPETVAATFPFWSPDSRSLGFFVLGKMKRVELSGGSPVDVTDAVQGRGAAWGPGGLIVFSPAPNAPLMTVNAAGGTPQPLTKLDEAQHSSHRWPAFLPDGKHFLYLALNHDPTKAGNDAIYYASLDGRENRLLFRTSSSAIYAAGFLLFAQGSTLMAQSFNPANGELKGDPQAIANEVIHDPANWHLDVSAAENGLLVFGSGTVGTVQLLWVDRSGKDLGVVADHLGDTLDLRLSPQGDKLAFRMGDGGLTDIWVLDLARGVKTKLTFGPIVNYGPTWSSDGKWIYYSSYRNSRVNLFRRAADGSTAEEAVFAGDNDVYPADCSPNGKVILLAQVIDGKISIWALPLAEPGKPWKVVENGGVARFSPDGRYVAYQSQESGQWQIYVVPFGDRQGKWQVSPTMGVAPQWSRDGRELFYVDAAHTLFSVLVKEQGDALQFGSPQPLVTRSNLATRIAFAVSPDSKKILIERPSQQVNQSVTLVTNFTEGLKK